MLQYSGILDARFPGQTSSAVPLVEKQLLRFSFMKRQADLMSSNSVPIKEFRLSLSDHTFTGHDLVRPESIIARPDGTLLVSDGRGGVTRIDPDGSQHFIGGPGGEPNGLALLDDDSILIANIGTGGIQKLSPDGRVEDFLT